MSVKTGMQIKGTIEIRVERPDGSVLKVRQKNLVMYDWGLKKVASLLAGVAQGANMITHLAMGTDNTPPAEDQSILIGETIRDACVITQQADPEANKVEYKVVHALGAVTGTFEEAGLFDAGTGGNMFNRVIFAPFIVTSADTLTVVWVVEVKNV